MLSERKLCYKCSFFNGFTQTHLYLNSQNLLRVAKVLDVLLFMWGKWYYLQHRVLAKIEVGMLCFPMIMSVYMNFVAIMLFTQQVFNLKNSCIYFCIYTIFHKDNIVKNVKILCVYVCVSVCVCMIIMKARNQFQFL